MKRNTESRFLRIPTVLGLVMLLAVTSGVCSYFGSRLAQNQVSQQQNYPPLPTLDLNAGTSARSKSMSMATGLVDGNVEGLFLLDHVSGKLQCWVLSPKTGAVGGYYVANPGQDLMGAGKTGQPEYMMVTGNFFFASSGNVAPGQSICYVADANSGNVIGYGLVYDKQGIKRGVPQKGFLKVICKGTARTGVTTRDQ